MKQPNNPPDISEFAQLLSYLARHNVGIGLIGASPSGRSRKQIAEEIKGVLRGH